MAHFGQGGPAHIPNGVEGCDRHVRVLFAGELPAVGLGDHDGERVGDNVVHFAGDPVAFLNHGIVGPGFEILHALVAAANPGADQPEKPDGDQDPDDDGTNDENDVIEVQCLPPVRPALALEQFGDDQNICAGVEAANDNDGEPKATAEIQPGSRNRSLIAHNRIGDELYGKHRKR